MPWRESIILCLPRYLTCRHLLYNEVRRASKCPTALGPRVCIWIPYQGRGSPSLLHSMVPYERARIQVKCQQNVQTANVGRPSVFNMVRCASDFSYRHLHLRAVLMTLSHLLVARPDDLFGLYGPCKDKTRNSIVDRTPLSGSKTCSRCFLARHGKAGGIISPRFIGLKARRLYGLKGETWSTADGGAFPTSGRQTGVYAHSQNTSWPGQFTARIYLDAFWST